MSWLRPWFQKTILTEHGFEFLKDLWTQRTPFSWVQELSALRSWEISMFFKKPKITPKTVQGLDLGSSDGKYALCLMAFHMNGFVREAAVARMEELPFEMSLFVLLLRANDWVPEIRDQSRKKLFQIWDSCFSGPDGEEFLFQSLPAFWKLSRVTREEPSSLLKRFWEWFIKKECPDLLLGDTSLDLECRRWASLQIFKNGFQPRTLVPWLETGDPILTIRLFRWVSRSCSQKTLLLCLETLEKARSFFLRKEALSCWCERFPDEVIPKCEVGLLDSAPSVRRTAAFYLGKCGVDPRDWVQDQRRLHPVDRKLDLSFLELAGPNDKDEVKAFLSPGASSPARLRLAAYRYFLRIEGEAERVLDGLCDPSCWVAKSLQRSCQRARKWLPIPLLRRRLGLISRRCHRDVLLRVLQYQSSIVCLVEALRPVEPVCPKGIVRLIQNLLRRLAFFEFSRPDPAMLQELESAMGTLPSGFLDEWIRKDLEETVRILRNR